MIIRINITTVQMEALQLALKIYSLSVADRTLEEKELYQYYIIKKVYIIVQKKIINLIELNRTTGKIKLDQVQCVAMVKAITTSPKPESFPESQAIALDNFLLELGRVVPHTLTPNLC